MAPWVSINTDPKCGQTIVYAAARDPDGTVARVDLWYQPYQTAAQPVKPVDVLMTTQGGGAWQGTTQGGSWPSFFGSVPYQVPYWIIITDNRGATTRIDGTKVIGETVCA